MSDTWLVNVLPAGTSETLTAVLVKKNGAAVVGAYDVRLTLLKRTDTASVVGNVGPVSPTTGLPLNTTATPYDAYASLEFKVKDPNQSAITASVSQLSKVPGSPAIGMTTSATRTPIRTQRAVPGDTIQICDPTTGTALGGVASFVVPGEWNDVGNATDSYGDSAVANP
jgi:hypothetical protein